MGLVCGVAGNSITGRSSLKSLNFKARPTDVQWIYYTVVDENSKINTDLFFIDTVTCIPVWRDAPRNETNH